MNYIEYIESSTTWRCPKGGLWKVICVGGGSSGGYGYISSTGSIKNSPLQSEGKDTSFGEILSAKGGKKCNTYGHSSSYSIITGQHGYDLFSYGHILTGDHQYFRTSKYEYGAGGDSNSTYRITNLDNKYADAHGVPGMSGQIKVTITSLEQDQSITCTIGAGGKVSEVMTEANLKDLAKKLNSDLEGQEFTVSAEEAQDRCTDGYSGVIVLQYLGAEI